MSTSVLVKFKFPVVGIKTYETDDEAAAIKMAVEEYAEGKDDFSATIFNEDDLRNETVEAVPGAGGVRQSSGSNDTTRGDDSSRSGDGRTEGTKSKT